MNVKRNLLDDPVVREVRAWREALWAEAGGTTEEYLRLLRQRKAERDRARERERPAWTDTGAEA